MKTETLVQQPQRSQIRPSGLRLRTARLEESATLRSYVPATPTLRAALSPQAEETMEFPKTPIERLLEVSCGLTHEQVERLLAARPEAETLPAPAEAAYMRIHTGFQIGAWGVFLATFAYALIQAV